jgi:hypothetical protein
MKSICQSRLSQRLVGGLAALVGLALSIASPQVADAATSFTWSGGGGANHAWSAGTNWIGGTAPSSGASLTSVTLPELSSGTISDNDLTGVSTEQLSLNDTRGLMLSGNPLTLGSGGLTLETGLLPATATITAPVVLASDQTWNVNGPSTPEVFDFISLEGQLSGEASSLTVNLNTNSELFFGSPSETGGPDDELGNVVLNGKLGATNFVRLPAGLNGSDQRSLTVKNVELSGKGPTGPITGENASLELGGSEVGALQLKDESFGIFLAKVSSLLVDPTSTLFFNINAPGKPSGMQENKVTSTGAVTLENSPLLLTTFENEDEQCPPPVVGQIDTLISTTGSLKGSFANTPDGSIRTVDCEAINHGTESMLERIYSFRINYKETGSPQTVTATALPAVPALEPETPQLPAIAGSPTAGQSLAATHAGWANGPISSYGDQWERCSGASCQPIAGATSLTYVVSSADVGSTLRLQETASNGEGTSQAAFSLGTAAVQGAPSPGPAPPPTEHVESTPPPRVELSASQIGELLAKPLSLLGKGTSIPALLKRGSLSLSVNPGEPGELTVQLWEVPRGAHLAEHAKPVLIASGSASFSAASTKSISLRLTAAGKKLLKKAKTITLTARARFTPTAKTPITVTKTIQLKRR